MLDWYESSNGNYVYSLSKGDVMTVYKKKDGNWGGIYGEGHLHGSYDTPEEAQKLMERWVIDGDLSLATSPKIGWRKSKIGSYYKTVIGGMASVKQAKSGKWFISIRGNLVKDVWLDSAEEAMKKANEYVEYL
jgi:hypothetical protein